MYDYVKQHNWAKLKVGIVGTIAFLTVFFAVMFAGNIEKFFVPRVIITGMADDVKGLREGAPVWFSGVEIGAVKSIEFTMERKVRFKMMIASDSLKYLKEDSKANILTLGLLGDKYVEITPGTKDASALKPGDTISGSTQIEINDVVQTSQASIAKITDFIGKLEEILLNIRQGKGSVSKFFRDPSVYDNIEEATNELKALTGKVSHGKGTVARLLNDDNVYVDLSSSVNDIKIFAKTLKASEGSLNKLIKDPSLFDRFQKASESLDTFTQRLVSSEGTLNKLIEDKKLYENVTSASGKLNVILEKIEKGEGIAGSLVSDDELSKELRSTLEGLNALMKDIKENPKRYFKFSIF
ncbi:MAG TPA: MCE family protein [Nitrospirae bacterium]|nr:MCE family protein [Nitrospirota bacterium]